MDWSENFVILELFRIYLNIKCGWWHVRLMMNTWQTTMAIGEASPRWMEYFWGELGCQQRWTR